MCAPLGRCLFADERMEVVFKITSPCSNIRSDHSFFSIYIYPSIKFVIAQPRYIHSVMLKGMIPRWRQPRARGRAGLQVMRTECIVI